MGPPIGPNSVQQYSGIHRYRRQRRPIDTGVVKIQRVGRPIASYLKNRVAVYRRSRTKKSSSKKCNIDKEHRLAMAMLSESTRTDKEPFFYSAVQTLSLKKSMLSQIPITNVEGIPLGLSVAQ